MMQNSKKLKNLIRLIEEKKDLAVQENKMSTFNTSIQEDKNFEKFKKKQKKKYGKDSISGTFTFSFTNNGIGTSILVTNNKTAETEDITDYENW